MRPIVAIAIRRAIIAIRRPRAAIRAIAPIAACQQAHNDFPAKFAADVLSF